MIAVINPVEYLANIDGFERMVHACRMKRDARRAPPQIPTVIRQNIQRTRSKKQEKRFLKESRRLRQENDNFRHNNNDDEDEELPIVSISLLDQMDITDKERRLMTLYGERRKEWEEEKQRLICSDETSRFQDIPPTYVLSMTTMPVINPEYLSFNPYVHHHGTTSVRDVSVEDEYMNEALITHQRINLVTMDCIQPRSPLLVTLPVNDNVYMTKDGLRWMTEEPRVSVSWLQDQMELTVPTTWETLPVFTTTSHHWDQHDIQEAQLNWVCVHLSTAGWP